MADKRRADIALVQQHLCDTRERAQAAIMEGRVYLGEKRINKASELVGTDEILTLRASDNDYVSRGALKLEKAVRVFNADLADRVIMDIGSSTGGFTDVCLRCGAKHVYSIDVGYGQLDWKLRNDPRVTVMERTNARFLEPSMFEDTPSVAVMDVSFISIRLILPAAAAVMGDNGVFYTLIKPQFEAGRENVGKNGVVRNPAVHENVISGIVSFADEMEWQAVALDYSPITGPKGNIEFLAEIRKKSGSRKGITAEEIRGVVLEAHEKMAHSRS